LIAFGLLIGTPFFILFGWLSDKIGRKSILLAGCLIAAITYFPLFKMIAQEANPKLMAATEQVKVDLISVPAPKPPVPPYDEALDLPSPDGADDALSEMPAPPGPPKVWAPGAWFPGRV